MAESAAHQETDDRPEVDSGPAMDAAGSTEDAAKPTVDAVESTVDASDSTADAAKSAVDAAKSAVNAAGSAAGGRLEAAFDWLQRTVDARLPALSDPVAKARPFVLKHREKIAGNVLCGR